MLGPETSNNKEERWGGFRIGECTWGRQGIVVEADQSPLMLNNFEQLASVGTQLCLVQNQLPSIYLEGGPMMGLTK